jgi:hypothetical protein
LCVIQSMIFWYIDVSFPYKNSKTCDVVRGPVIWTIWKKKNISIFEGGNGKSLRGLGKCIIFLAKYWCLK